MRNSTAWAYHESVEVAYDEEGELCSGQRHVQPLRVGDEPDVAPPFSLALSRRLGSVAGGGPSVGADATDDDDVALGALEGVDGANVSPALETVATEFVLDAADLPARGNKNL